MKSNRHGEAVLSSADTAILSGFWIAYISDTHSDSFHFFHLRELQVRSRLCQSSPNCLLTSFFLDKIEVNGTHLTADSNSFLEKRRRGLVRFVNALVRHPVLSQEQLVVMFLTVPTVSNRYASDKSSLSPVFCFNIVFFTLTRNSQYGVSKLQCRYKMNSQAKFFPRTSKILYHLISRRHLTPFELA